MSRLQVTAVAAIMLLLVAGLVTALWLFADSSPSLNGESAAQEKDGSAAANDTGAGDATDPTSGESETADASPPDSSTPGTPRDSDALPGSPPRDSNGDDTDDQTTPPVEPGPSPTEPTEPAPQDTADQQPHTGGDDEPEHAGRLSGAVTATDGRPLNDVRITVTRLRQPGHYISPDELPADDPWDRRRSRDLEQRATTTGADGSFALDNLRLEGYRLRVHRIGYVAQSEVVEFTAAQPHQLRDFTLERLPVVVRPLDWSRNPIEGEVFLALDEAGTPCVEFAYSRSEMAS